MTNDYHRNIELGRLYRVREFAEICGVHYRTALNWVQLGEIDSVNISTTYLHNRREDSGPSESEVYVY